MKGYEVYNKIKQLKERGFKQAAVAKKLNIHRNTVKRYWDMSLDEYEQMNLKINRLGSLDGHKQIILDWLNEYPSMSASQVCDWLKEHYDLSYPERTVSRYVRILREEYDIRKSKNPRDYEAIEDPPMGQQLQIDFGSKWMLGTSGNRIKVHFAAYSLSNSRYKYVAFQSHPFTSGEFVNTTKSCFIYIGGIPKEIVIDQDSILTVDENYGDIIYTYEFEQFRSDYEFKMYVCRKSDPESKGRIENVVGYVKKNFLEHRKYPGDDEALNRQALAWLERTANAKKHGTTKIPPSVLWKEEVNHLNPLIVTNEYVEESLVRRVRKDNTIIFKSNRYSLPLGTFHDYKEVNLNIMNQILQITTPTDDIICEHRINFGSGRLIKNIDHSRDKSKSVDEIQAVVSEMLDGNADEYLALQGR